MEALQFNPSNQALELKHLTIPVVTNPDDVIVKVAYAGICGTDLQIIEGKFPASDSPLILGHEFGGKIHQVGCSVTNVKIGDRVGVNPNIGCGLCKYCHSGKDNVCPNGALNTTIGIFFDGGWAEYCKVTAKHVYKLPDCISFKQAVLLEPLSCLYHGFSRILPVHYDGNIIVNGAGIIGNLWCSLLHHMGYRKVTVVEPEEVRRELMKKLETGFKLIHPKAMSDYFAEDGLSGVDVVIDSSGSAPAIESSFRFLNRGGKICIFGVASPEARISISPFDIFYRELSVYGVVCNLNSYQHSIGLMEDMGSRYIDYERLGVQEFSMKEYNEALDTLRKRKISKGVFKIDSGSGCQ